MLQIANLRKSFEAAKRESRDRVMAVDGVSVTLERGEFFTLLGPSGCGKTTTLRCIAGLERADEGEIRVGDRVLFSGQRRVNVPPNQRGLGMVFQSYAIWPHLNVFRNVAFPLTVAPRKARLSRKEIRERVERILTVVELESMAYRPSTDLSGGQQQRLALARALVMEPDVLLLDEPLSNLDAKLREDMRLELKRLQRQLAITTVYVTHDQSEALAMSNRIAVMRHGRFEQVGSPRDIYQSPASRFVASFIGASNFITGTVESVNGDGNFTVKTECGALEGRSAHDLVPGDQVDVGIRLEHVQLRPDGGGETEPAPGRWQGTVLARAFLGDAVEHLVKVGDVRLRVRAGTDVSIPDGTPVELHVPPTGSWLFVRDEADFMHSRSDEAMYA